MLLLLSLPVSTLVCAISETSVSVLSLSQVSCALMRPVILNGATLFSWIHIFPCIFLEVKQQYGSGSTRVVARTGNPTCPFNMLHRYAQLSGDGVDSTEFVFRSLSKGKNGNYPFELVLSFPIPGLENFLLRSLRPLALILSSTVFILSGLGVLLQPLMMIYQIVLLRSMAVESQRKLKILTVGKIFNTSC